MDVYEDRGPKVSLFFVGERSDKRLSWPVGANRPFRLMEFGITRRANGQTLGCRQTGTNGTFGFTGITSAYPVRTKPPGGGRYACGEGAVVA